MEGGAGGKLQKAPAPDPSLETLKSQILSCSYTNPSETEVHRRLCVDISIHCPVPEAGNPRPHLSHSLTRPQRRELPRCPPFHQFSHQLPPLSSGPAVSTPTSAQWAPKGPRKEVSNPGVPLKQVIVLSFGGFLFLLVGWLFFVCLLFCLFRAAPAAYGGSQARGQVGTMAASLLPQPQQHGIQAASETYTTAHGNARSLTH